MFVGTKTFDDTTKRLEKEIVALKARALKLEKLTVRMEKVEALAVKATALEQRLDKLPEQMLSLETSRRLWPMGDYRTGG